MALIFCDSFSHYATADILQKWSSMTNSQYVSIVNTPVRRAGTQALRITQSGIITKSVSLSSTVIIVGFAIRLTAYNSSDYVSFLRFMLGGKVVPQCSVAVDPVGTISLWKSAENYSGAVMIGSAPSQPLVLNTWHYLEMMLRIENPTGTVNMYLNGEQLENLFGLTDVELSFNSTYGVYDFGCDWIRLINASGNTINPTYFQDLVIMDDYYVSGYYDFAYPIGDVRIDVLRPETVGTYNSQWSFNNTGLAQDVDDVTPDGDDSYITADVDGDRVSFNFQDIPAPEGATIHGVVLNNVAKKADAGVSRIVPFYRSQVGFDYNQDPIYLADNYVISQRVFSRNPANLGIWSESGIEDGQFGVMYDATI